MEPTLRTFIDHARGKGMDHATIRMLLLSAGWKDKEIARALTEQALEVPVPAPPDVGGAREAFLHLVAFAALYAAAFSTVWILVFLLDLWFPDPASTPWAASPADWRLPVVRGWMAALIVSFPLLLWLSRIIVGETRATPDKARSPVRRWLTYLTLFAAAIALAGDGVALVARLLGGELSIRFVLKVIVVLVLAGGIYLYYFATLRMTPREAASTRLHRNVAWAAGVVVATILVAGFLVVGGPAAARLAQFDARRVEDLQLIRDEVFDQTLGARWRAAGAVVPEMQRPLPATLEEVAREGVRRQARIADPQTGAPYEYEVTGTATFRLCARFDTARDEPGDVAWNHPPGRHCFDFDAQAPGD